ncbi:hypothetical protein B0H13DRAFT_1969509 [Mycena leptocephala]|nr:hypothetical protein B0H13DRAFT_1969509 [Mycena leptocephala]
MNFIQQLLFLPCPDLARAWIISVGCALFSGHSLTGPYRERERPWTRMSTKFEPTKICLMIKVWRQIGDPWLSKSTIFTWLSQLFIVGHPQ